MSVPKYVDFIKPILQLLSDKKEHSVRSMYDDLALQMNLSEADLAEEYQGGNGLVYKDRISWANTYLFKAGLIERVRRGIYQITPHGLGVFEESPPIIDTKYLLRFPSFQEFFNYQGKQDNENAAPVPVDITETPQGVLNRVYTQINNNLKGDLLAEIYKQSPSFFERLVVDLLRAMGYGDWSVESGSVVGKSGDEGIDGIIKEDKLGFDAIYIQAKKWDPTTTVGRKEIQEFVGALAGQGATKGLFITSAAFSAQAREYVKKQHQAKVVLVDGKTLAGLMVEHNLGVSVTDTLLIKKIDFDYFEGNV